MGEPPKAGETAGLPRGCESGERSEREGAARPLRIGVNKRVARLTPACGGLDYLILVSGSNCLSQPEGEPAKQEGTLQRCHDRRAQGVKDL